MEAACFHPFDFLWVTRLSKTKPKVFIVGISGLIGYALGLHLRKNFLVSGACFSNQVWIPGAQIFPINLKTTEVLDTVIRMQNPDFIISAAGMNDRKLVDELPKVSDMINVMLPVSTAILAGRLKAKFIYLGCAEVYDGNQGMYKEEDTDFTLSDSVGKQKITAHSYIRAQTMESTTLRIGRVIGIGHPFRMSFFDRFRFASSAGQTYEASKNKTRSYISCQSLVNAFEQVMLNEIPSKHRTFHVGGANITEHDLVSSWYKLMGADPKLVRVLQDAKRDLSLDCGLFGSTYKDWKIEDKNKLLLNALTELTPAVGPKKWLKTLQTP